MTIEKALRHTIPFTDENKWSNLLATLIEIDPTPLGGLLGLDFSEDGVVVGREQVSGRDRIDLLLDDGTHSAAIEVKVLAGLGNDQLGRYRAAYPGLSVYALIHPAEFDIEQTGWLDLTWEQVLSSYSTSGDAWVAATASAWLAYLDASIPKVDASTVWNDIDAGTSASAALRARLSWVFSQITSKATTPGIHFELGSSASGRSPIVKAWRAVTDKPDYAVNVEVEETLGSRGVPTTWDANSTLKGPGIKVSLIQSHVKSSRNFDWDYLHRSVWPPMQTTDLTWDINKKGPADKDDRERFRALVSQGFPPELGYGFGNRMAKKWGSCMFGGRAQLRPDTTLAELAAAMTSLISLLPAMTSSKDA